VGTDTQELVWLWRDGGEHCLEVAAIMEDDEDMVSAFASFRVIYTRRLANFAVIFVPNMHQLLCKILYRVIP
jgi:hypothetical protein